MTETAEFFEDVSNPLDSVEDILSTQDWVFSRPNDDELSVTVSGRHGQYYMTFIWQEEYSAMQFFCELDMTVPAERREAMASAMQTINSRLWLGHFIVQEQNNVPSFRHTSLFRGCTHTSGTEHVEDLVEIAMAECERYYPALHLLCTTQGTETSLFNLALADPAGES
jgi:hypothetical protein